MTDAKVYAMIEDLSQQFAANLLAEHGISADADEANRLLREAYEAGDIAAHDIIFAWEDDRYECAECGAGDHPTSECPHGGHQ